MDPISRRRFWDLIYELADTGVTVFVTTHYMDEAEYCDRIGLIYRGELIALGTPEELKTRSMSEVILELSCDQPVRAMEEIERLDSVKEAALFGKGLHVVVDDPEPATEAIATVLSKKGIALAGLEAITPSLEDVFVSLIEARDRAGDDRREVNR